MPFDLQDCSYGRLQGGKPWRYALIPHDRIAENMGLEMLAR